MEIKKKSLLLIIVSMIFLGFFLTINPEKTQAATYESTITFPLPGSGTVTNSVLTLIADSQKTTGTILFKAGNPNDVVSSTADPNTNYFTIDVDRQGGGTRWSHYAKGNTLQANAVTQLNNKSIVYGDIIRLSIRSSELVKINNYNGTSFNYDTGYTNFRYLLTPGGFIPVSDAFMFRTYDNTTSTTYPVAYQITSIFSSQIATSSIASTIAAFNANEDTSRRGFSNEFTSLFTNANTWKFHLSLSDTSNEYASLTKYNVTLDHKLSSPLGSAKAQPSTTIGDFATQVKPVRTNNKSGLAGDPGTIYRVYSKDTSRAVIFSGTTWKQVSQAETYYEYTDAKASSALKELDFNKVAAKNVTIELGSDTSEQPVTNFSTVQSYSGLTSTFGETLKSDRLGTYDLPITIRQPLSVNENYLNSIVTSKVTVVDTTKPTGTIKPNLTIPVNGVLELKDMFSEVNDNSGKENLTYEYVGNGVDSTTSGSQTVTVRLKDPSGNFNDYKITVQVVPGNIGMISADTFSFGKIKAGSTSKNIELKSNQTAGISMEDNRGTKGGWSVQAKTSVFSPKNGTTGKAFVAGIKLPKGIASINEKISEDLTGYEITLNESAQNVVSAAPGKGMNKWSYSFGTTENPVSLANIPSTLYIGDYEAIITWSMINAPN